MADKPTYKELAQRVNELEGKEAEIKASEVRFRELFKYMSSGVAVYEAKDNGNDFIFKDFNRAGERIENVKKENLLGKSVLEMFPGVKEFGLFDVFRRVWETGKPEHHPVSLYKDNRITGWKENYVYKLPSGEIVAVYDDVSEHKKAEKALRKSEEKLNSILQSVGDNMSMIDKDLNIIWANKIAKEVFGNDIIGKKCYEVYHQRKEPCEPYPCLTLKAFQDGKVHEHDTQVIDQDGKKIFFHCTANVALRDKNGKPTAVVEISRDITKNKLLEEQLKQAQKMEAISTLASGFAHNFNNLLMGIIANTSIMLFDIDSNHQHYKYLKNIEKLVKSGSKVAIQFTGYARVKRYNFKPINMNQLLKETSDTFGMGKKKIRLHQNIAERLHVIEADKEQLEQALLNLYINAVDAMSEGGDLFFKTMNVTDQDMIGKTYKPKPGKYVLLTVRDTGIGMDKKTKERIFEPFFTTKDNIQGTGLGLSSTYNIIKAHGGYIDVDSEKGVGTTFSIYLPATKKKIKEKKEPSVEILKGKGTILLVDDDDAVIEGCKKMLEKMGYIVSIAKNGREAIEIYGKSPEKVDLVILDIIMSGMGGGETYNRLKEINPDIKVLLTSGNSINGQANEILERGCNGFIQKPFNMEDLSRNMRGIFDKK